MGRIDRDAEDRSVVWAAGVTAFPGLSALLGGAAAHLDGDVLGARPPRPAPRPRRPA